MQLQTSECRCRVSSHPFVGRESAFCQLRFLFSFYSGEAFRFFGLAPSVSIDPNIYHGNYMLSITDFFIFSRDFQELLLS